MKKLIAFIFILTLSGCSFLGMHTEEEYTSALDYKLNEKTEFTVDAGLSTRSIASKLAKEEIIKEPWAFEWYVSREGLSGKLQAGDYTLQKGWTIAEIANTMLTARKDEVSVTIPEGYRLTQIDETFAEKGLIKSGEILALKDMQTDSYLTKNLPAGVDLEGYLFPDTYFFEKENAIAEDIIERMLQTMETKMTDEMVTEIWRQGKTIHEILTVASLIERESFAEDERNIISGIIWNRLDAEMPLGIDATIQYAVSDGWPNSLTYDDLQVDDPYNTRKYAGLPPGPICSPSLASIAAAIYPADTDYWYYLHDSEGKIHYATTNEGHNENKRLYLQ